MSEFKDYFQTLTEVLSDWDMPQLESICKEITRHDWVAVIGNGGSAANASHFAADMTKSASWVNAVSLNSIPAITALSNDNGYENIFSDWLMQIWALGGPRGMLIAISTSGNSKNVLRAVEWAKTNGIFTVVMTGFDGGQLLGQCDTHNIHVPCDTVEIVEDVHMAILHSIIKRLKD